MIVYAYVVDCVSDSPYVYSSSTHRFHDERKPSEAMPLSATSLVWDWVWVWDWIHWHTEQIKDIIIGTLLLAYAPLLLSSLLSHTIPFPRVH